MVGRGVDVAAGPERAGAGVEVEPIALTVVTDGEIEPAVSIDVAQGDRGGGAAVGRDVRARRERAGGVEIEPIRLALVADDQVRVAVVIDVAHGQRRRLVRPRLDLRAGREAGGPRGAARFLVQPDAVVLGAGDQVQAAVFVDVRERQRGHLVGQRRDRRLGDEGAAFERVQQDALAVGADGQVHLAVAVHVSERQRGRLVAGRVDVDAGLESRGLRSGDEERPHGAAIGRRVAHRLRIPRRLARARRAGGGAAEERIGVADRMHDVAERVRGARFPGIDGCGVTEIEPVRLPDEERPLDAAVGGRVLFSRQIP